MACLCTLSDSAVIFLYENIALEPQNSQRSSTNVKKRTKETNKECKRSLVCLWFRVSWSEWENNLKKHYIIQCNGIYWNKTIVTLNPLLEFQICILQEHVIHNPSNHVIHSFKQIKPESEHTGTLGSFCTLRFLRFFCKVHSESQEAYNNSKQLANTTNVIMCKLSLTGWRESSSQTENGRFWERSLSWNSTERLRKHEKESASIRKTWCPHGRSSPMLLEEDEMLTSQKEISGDKKSQTLWDVMRGRTCS